MRRRSGPRSFDWSLELLCEMELVVAVVVAGFVAVADLVAGVVVVEHNNSVEAVVVAVVVVAGVVEHNKIAEADAAAAAQNTTAEAAGGIAAAAVDAVHLHVQVEEAVVPFPGVEVDSVVGYSLVHP